MNIGTKIHTRRKELGLTLEQVANACDVSKTTISKWENGIIDAMRQDKVSKLAKVLQVSPLYLLYEDTPVRPVPQAEDISELLEIIKSRPEMRMLFSVSKNCTKEDIEKTIKIIETLKANGQ